MSFFSQIDICPKKINRLLSNLAVKTNINKIISGFLGSKFFETHTVVSVVYNPPPHGLQTPNEVFFSSNSQTFGLGQIDFGAFGRSIFGRFIGTHFYIYLGLGFEYKGLFFFRYNGWFMGADKSAENTPNTQKLICPNCLPTPKSLGIR